MRGHQNPAPLALLLLVIVASVHQLEGFTTCTQAFIGEREHYFDDYTEVTYNISCGDLCTLPESHDLRSLAHVKVYFPQNTSRVDCSWIITGFLNNSKSTVMFFEQEGRYSLGHDIVCGESGPASLTMWDEYSFGEDVQTTYNICREPTEYRDEAHNRRSSRLGNFDTLITLKNYAFRPASNPTLLKYITVDWSQDCFEDYHEIVVNSSEKMITLGSRWFTSNLRLPNRMHCRWGFSTPDSSTDMIRLRVTVLDRTTIPGSCVQDDFIRFQGGGRTEDFTLCDDSRPQFFASFARSVLVDFQSGPTTGAPEFQISYSAIDTCPRERLHVKSDLTENVVYGVLKAGQTPRPCQWTVFTNFTYNVIMLTRVTVQQPCNDGDYLHLDLGSTVRRIDLCEMDNDSFPVWSTRPSVDLELHLRAPSSRRVSLFYKSVPKMAACQGHPAQLESFVNEHHNVMVDMTDHRSHLDHTAPDCRWLIAPSSQVANADAYAAEVLVSDFLFEDEKVGQNRTTTAWMTSGLRAYAGSDVNATAALRVNCVYASHSVECRYLSTSHTLLLVYDLTLSTSPTPLSRISIGYQQVRKKDSSGQAGSVWRSAWHAQQLPLLCVAVVLKLVVF